MLLIVCSLVPLLTWLYLTTARGGFWRVSTSLARDTGIDVPPRRIVAVIPARNEADVVGDAVASLLNQRDVAPMHVILVDDASNDRTAERARSAAERAGAADRLRIVDGAPLESGWTGKLWAVSQGVERAAALNPDYLLLTDADIAHAPRNVANLLSVAESGDYDLTSFMVKLHCSTLVERALIPAFVFFFFLLYPPAWVRNNRSPVAGAAGGCMLIRPSALRAIGGIAAIHDRIIDDCALANAVKSNGGRVWLGLTESARSIRPYETFGEIGRMISRSAFNQLRHSPVLLVGTLLMLFLTYVLPPLSLFSGQLVPALFGAAAWASMSICYLPMVRFYRCSPAWALALPLVAIFYGGATVDSALRYWRGRGGSWKGRVQDTLSP